MPAVPTYLANFDFDDRLAGRTGGSRMPPPLERPPSQAHLFRLLEDGLVTVVVPSLVEPSRVERDGPLAAAEFVADVGRERFEPWGWDLLAGRIGGGEPSDGHLIKAAERVNHRRFAARFGDGEWTDDAAAVLRRAAAGERIMMKSAHGSSGRGLRRVLGPESDVNLVNWVRRRCRRGGLVVEPLVPPVAEFATHFDVGDAVVVLGTTRLEANEHGQFVMSVADPDAGFEVPKVVREAGDAARSAGYRGPLSIDSAVLPGGSLRAVQDVNARWTVGRVALLASRRIGGRVAVRNDAGRWSVRTPDGDFRLPGP